MSCCGRSFQTEEAANRGMACLSLLDRPWGKPRQSRFHGYRSTQGSSPGTDPRGQSLRRGQQNWGRVCGCLSRCHPGLQEASWCRAVAPDHPPALCLPVTCTSDPHPHYLPDCRQPSALCSQQTSQADKSRIWATSEAGGTGRGQGSPTLP